MDINSYFELYMKTRVKYDRLYHINNCGFDFSLVNQTLVKNIFSYLDMVIFGGKIKDYMKDHNINFAFKVSSALTSTAGMFYHMNDGGTMGLKISSKFFQNIIDNNITNIDLGVVDEHNKKYLSKNVIEPLFATIEHEMIHLIMYITKNNKLNDLHKVKSGHTPIFKRLIYNIFGHYKITHSYSVGDVKENLEKMKEIKFGDYVKIIDKNFFGYVVGMKNRGAILCNVKPDGTTEYSSAFYKNIIKIDTNRPIDLQKLLQKLKPGVKILYNKNTFEISQINKTTITVTLESFDPKLTVRGKFWNIPKSRILDISFI